MRDLARYLQQNGPYDYLNLKEAKARYATFRGSQGAKAVATRLLTYPDENVKFNKTDVPIYGLALAHAATSTVNVCRFSTPECRAACVSDAGMGRFHTVQNGRIRKTLFLQEDPSAFLTLLMHELQGVWTHEGQTARVRLNTFSDLVWETICPEIFERYSALRFYDYTKWPNRRTPANYRLCWSASERSSPEDIKKALASGMTAAVVFAVKRNHPLPATYLDHPVIDGDKSDDRWSDPLGAIVGLRAKGRMRSGTWNMARKAS